MLIDDGSAVWSWTSDNDCACLIVHIKPRDTVHTADGVVPNLESDTPSSEVPVLP